MPAYTVTVSSQTDSPPVPINLKRYKQGCGLIVTITGTLTASIQVTGDNVFGNTYVASSGNWNNHDTLVTLTASANGNLAFPVTAVRIHCSAYTSGSVTLSVVQAED
jgi:hypothetical protein